MLLTSRNDSMMNRQAVVYTSEIRSPTQGGFFLLFSRFTKSSESSVGSERPTRSTARQVGGREKSKSIYFGFLGGKGKKSPKEQLYLKTKERNNLRSSFSLGIGIK
jgi:hypothetical protein